VHWNGPDSVRYAQTVRQWADDVVLFVPAGVLTNADRGHLVARAVGIVEVPIAGLVVEDDHLTGVELTDGHVVPRGALFVPPRFVPHDGLLTRLGCQVDEQGWIVVGQYGATSVRGVWAVGNVANPRAQVVTAAGEGSAAAIGINAVLVE
jgi:thioredoxin reductase